MKLIIERKTFQSKQTLGAMQVLDESGKAIYSCFTLELPDLQNQNKISCIPAGSYWVKKRRSPKYGQHFHILNVPDRSFILIHHGNYHTDILGCVLVGSGCTDINGDGLKDVTNSKKTMEKLLVLLPDSFELEIRNNLN